MTYRIINQFFDPDYEMGVLLELKNTEDGSLLIKTPLQLFDDLPLLSQLAPEDIRTVGFIVGDFHAYMGYNLIRNLG